MLCAGARPGNLGDTPSVFGAVPPAEALQACASLPGVYGALGLQSAERAAAAAYWAAWNGSGAGRGRHNSLFARSSGNARPVASGRLGSMPPLAGKQPTTAPGRNNPVMQARGLVAWLAVPRDADMKPAGFAACIPSAAVLARRAARPSAVPSEAALTLAPQATQSSAARGLRPRRHKLCLKPQVIDGAVCSLLLTSGRLLQDHCCSGSLAYITFFSRTFFRRRRGHAGRWAQGSLGHGHLHRDGQQSPPPTRPAARRAAAICGAQQPKRDNPATASRSAGSCGPGRSSARQPRCRGLAALGPGPAQLGVRGLLPALGMAQRGPINCGCPRVRFAFMRQGRHHGGVTAKGTSPACGPVDRQVHAAGWRWSPAHSRYRGPCSSCCWATWPSGLPRGPCAGMPERGRRTGRSCAPAALWCGRFAWPAVGVLGLARRVVRRAKLPVRLGGP